MPDPISLTSVTPRFALPYLFAGQAQKEVSVNQAHAMLDALLHPSITAEQSSPPLAAAEGQCWLVGAGATDGWQGHDGAIATMQAGSWVFAAPRNGMSVYDETVEQTRYYRDGWSVAAPVTEPMGGGNVDAQARAAISELIAALVSAGILPDA